MILTSPVSNPVVASSVGITPPVDPPPAGLYYLYSPYLFSADSKNAQSYLSWEDQEDADSWELYYGTAENAMTLLETLPKATRVYTHTGRTNGVVYYYKVRAKASTTVGKFSHTAQVKPTARTFTGVPGATPEPSQQISPYGGPGSSGISQDSPAFSYVGYIYAGYYATHVDLYENGRIIASRYLDPATVDETGGTTWFHQIANKLPGYYQYRSRYKNNVGVRLSTQGTPSVRAGYNRIKQVLKDDGNLLYNDVHQQEERIGLPTIDETHQVTHIKVYKNKPFKMAVKYIYEGDATNWVVASRDSSIATVSIIGDEITITPVAAGRTGIVVRDTISGHVRMLGLMVYDPVTNTIPDYPDYVGIGSVSEDYTSNLVFWEDIQAGLGGRKIDFRYKYIQSGAGTGNVEEEIFRIVVQSCRYALKVGARPTLILYYLNKGANSIQSFYDKMRDVTEMRQYFRVIKGCMEWAEKFLGEEKLWLIIEPDFLGYLAQAKYRSGFEGLLNPATQVAATSAAYTEGVLGTGDPTFANTLPGLVQAITYTCRKYRNQKILIGWKFNIWASPNAPPAPEVAATGAGNGWKTPVPANGVMKIPHGFSNFQEGKYNLYLELKAIAQWYKDCGVGLQNEDFVAIDKYGVDGGYQLSGGATADPTNSLYHWDADQWNGYLMYAQICSFLFQKPVIPWQIPVGHINGTSFTKVDGSAYPTLPNQQYFSEESAPVFFFGDTFTASTSPRVAWWTRNFFNDPKITYSGSTITWASHMAEAKAAGIIAFLYGAGENWSTHGVPTGAISPSGFIGLATDSNWWITKVQKYYENPMPLDMNTWTAPADPNILPP